MTAVAGDRVEPQLPLDLQQRLEESEGLQDLVRAMAETADVHGLLQALAQIARRQCHADATVVNRVTNGVAEVVAVAGRAEDRLGRHFPIRGTLTEAAIRDQGVLAATNYGLSGFTPPLPASGAADGFVIGPIMVAPLMTQGEALGVLVAMRAADSPAFGAREERRLGVIADHASIVLRKAQLFDEARAASKAKSVFLATMSHELRTPLTALTGYGELLADEIMGPLTPQQHETVERMRVVTHHLASMIDEVLTYSSIEAGREKVRVTEFAPDTVLRAAAAVVEPLAHKRGLEFSTEVQPGLPVLRSDEDKVRQILVNLAGNAVKFTSSGGVKLGVARAAPRNGTSEIRFSVADSGMGIAPQDFGCLFQPFSQVDGGLTRRHGGTGLGLYISERLAQLLNGRIDVQSTPGTGSLFELVLPLAPSEPHVAPHAALHAEPRSAGPD